MANDIIIGSGKIVKVEYQTLSDQTDDKMQFDAYGNLRRGRPRKITLPTDSKIVSYLLVEGDLSLDKFKQIKFNKHMEFGKEYDLVLRERKIKPTVGRLIREDEL